MAPAARRLAVPEGGFRDVAVLRLSSLGDVVLALPVVDALAAAWPAARLVFWVKEEYADAVRHHPAVTHVRALEPDARRLEDLISMGAELADADLIVDLHGSLRARVLAFRQPAPVLRAPSYRARRARWVHARWSAPPRVPDTVARYAAALRPLGLEAPGPPRLHAGAEADAWAAAWWAEWSPPGPVVALCPGARHPTKRWPEQHWAALDAALAAEGLGRLWLSRAPEREALPVLAAAAERDPAARWCVEPLPRMAALLSGCAAAVSGDSGLMHVAAARGTRVAALFGSTSPVLGFAPAGEGHAVLCRDEPCQPCTLHGRERCPLGHFRCMRALEPAEVATAARALVAAAR